MFSKILVPALALGLSLAACSAKVSAPDITIPTNPTAFAHKVTGPILDGHWLSGCEAYGFGKGYAVYSMTIEGQNVTRVTSEYSDSACNQPTRENIETGMFRYNVQYDSQNFEVEYRMRVENGSYDFPENIRFDGTTLSITDHVSGPGVVPHIVLKATH